MTFVTQRFENFRRNGMRRWARSQPAAIRAALFIPCLFEYLAFTLFCVAGLVAVVVLMTISACFGLDRQPEARPR